MIAVVPVSRSDAGALMAANLESRDYHAPWANPPVDAPEFKAWFEGMSTGRSAAWVARETGSGAVIGVMEISQIVLGRLCSAYLGYYGMVRFAGRGLMTQAVRRVTRLAFDEIGLHRLEANIQPGNLASIALATRLGFRKEGFSPRYLRVDGAWRDHERWALLADDPVI